MLAINISITRKLWKRAQSVSKLQTSTKSDIPAGKQLSSQMSALDQPSCAMVATSATESKEEKMESTDHSTETNGEATETHLDQVAIANTSNDKNTEATVDLDSISVANLVKLKFRKNFEGHGIFAGYIEVSIL